MRVTTETLIKALAAVTLPSIAWLLSLTSDLSRDQQRLLEAERRIQQLEIAEGKARQELHRTSKILSETAAIVRFIREELLP